jgi:hypothetical protein
MPTRLDEQTAPVAIDGSTCLLGFLVEAGGEKRHHVP